MQRLAALQENVNYWTQLRRAIYDAQELLALDDEELLPELEAEVARLEEEYARAEFRLLLSGPHDKGDALLAIHAGAGGTDSQDWAAMLLRMYLRWCERRGYKVDFLDQTDGEEAGIKSVLLSVRGLYAYGYLRAERGVHRLVRLSPFDAAHRRHTSFALVEVWPDIGDEIEIDIRPEDLEIETFRASSAGGQHVQKNETAVRIRHIPTGLIVSCQNERSLTQNKENALRVLKARLYELEEEKRREQVAALKGEHRDAAWGNQIRSYVLHPYQMVKDHRTEYETGNTQAVLDGDIDAFIEAYLRASIQQNG